MSSYLNLFLKTEITCLPRLISKYIGNYYNNALCNGATWLFVFWCLLHFSFDKFLHVFLKQLRYKEYVRDRLISSLWYLGFFGSAFVYCGATLTQNEVELFNFKKMHVPSDVNLPSQLLGYTVICTFYFHSALWEGLKYNSFITLGSYLLLATFLVVSYILRIVEISFTLTALMSIVKIGLEFTRCATVLTKRDQSPSKYVTGLLFILTLSLFTIIYLFIIPLTYIIPMGLQILTDYPNTLFLFLYFLLIFWVTMEIYDSILFKFVNHWLYHTKDVKNPFCSGSIVDCSIYVPRNDVTFTFNLLREETKAREEQMISLRKPKNRAMLVQTLKCMVAIKKKLSQRRTSDNSDSSDESEKSDDNPRSINEETALVDQDSEDKVEENDDDDLEEEEDDEDGDDEKSDTAEKN